MNSFNKSSAIFGLESEADCVVLMASKVFIIEMWASQKMRFHTSDHPKRTRNNVSYRLPTSRINRMY